MSPFLIRTNQLSPDSQHYLKARVYTSWPTEITLPSLKAITENSEESLIVLNELIKREDNFKTECQNEFIQAKLSLKKRKAWTIGVAINTLMLLAAATLLILFFPPAAAITLPFFAALGSWSPLLILTTFLPSLSLSIISLIKISHCKGLQKSLKKNHYALLELNEAQKYLENEIKLAPSCSYSTENTKTPNEAKHKGIRSSLFSTIEVAKSAENEEQEQVPHRKHSL